MTKASLGIRTSLDYREMGKCVGLIRCHNGLEWAGQERPIKRVDGCRGEVITFNYGDIG